MGALLLGFEQREALAQLRALALTHPIHMPERIQAIKVEAGRRAHMDQMRRQTIPLPVAFWVTFSIETGHPAGTLRHLSVSVTTAGRVPNPEAVWMLAEELGFVGGLTTCQIWMEDVMRGEDPSKAVNIVQPIADVYEQPAANQ